MACKILQRQGNLKEAESSFRKAIELKPNYAPFYSILRAITFGIPFLGITSKFLGFIVFAASIAILFVVPWLDRSKVQSIRYKGIYSKIAMVLFASSFITLGYLGTKPVNE